MKTKISIFKIVAILLISIFDMSAIAQVNYQDGLKVLNPKVGNWTKTSGKFESIQVTVTPAGCYTNYDIIMEISAKNTTLANSNDSLEAEYKFSLPAGSILHHAVLWMYNIPVKAEIYERNKAKLIYEGLVARRIDPMIIYQNTDNSYEARIFPINNPANRKIQISYLVPNAITSKGVEVPMDLRMFRSDLAGQTPNIYFKVANNTQLGAPTFLGNVQSATVGNYEEFMLPSTTNNLYLNNAIYFSLPANNNFFVAQPSSPNEGYYQFMLMPTINSSFAKNVYVVDYRTVTYLGYSTLMQMIKNKIKFSLSDLDSFNVVYVHNGNIQKMSPNWISATDISIDAAFASLPANLSNTNSLFLQSTSDAINFINNHGEEGNILMISNAGSVNNNAGFLNQLISTSKSMMNKNYLLSVFDFNNQFTYSLSNGTEYFYNNEYYFYNLSALTGGSYFNLRNNDNYYYYFNATSSFIHNFSAAFTSLNKLHSYDATLINGNTILHSDYKLKNKVVVPAGDAYMEVGQYINTPTNMQINYYYGIDTNNYFDNYAVAPILAVDTFTKKIWGSRYIDDLISNNGLGQFTATILNSSKDYDVLCEYTALLALEPDSISGTIVNENPTSTSDVTLDEVSTINAIPNPFSTQQTLEFTVPLSLSNKTWEIRVYNAVGQLVIMQEGNTKSSEKLRINWYSQDSKNLPQGIYIIHCRVGDYRKTIKVVKK